MNVRPARTHARASCWPSDASVGLLCTESPPFLFRFCSELCVFMCRILCGKCLKNCVSENSERKVTERLMIKQTSVK